MTAPLYILTDARGFTTCCRATQADLRAEVLRCVLLMPITLHHWQRVNSVGPFNGWKLFSVEDYHPW